MYNFLKIRYFLSLIIFIQISQKDISRKSTQINESILGDNTRFAIVETTTNFLTIFLYKISYIFIRTWTLHVNKFT